MPERSQSISAGADGADAVYYRDGVTSSVASRLMGRARRNVYALFLREIGASPGATVLDIGVSLVDMAEANMLERLYPFPERLTCAGIGDGLEFKKLYPKVSFVSIEPGKTLPFRDGQFDVAYSNAVLEHVGGPEARLQFVEEALRVAKKLFFVVPNRWFPVEHHTSIPFLHYAPSIFRWMLKRGPKSYWSERRNVDFLDRGDLFKEFGSLGATIKIEQCGLGLGPFSSNIAMIIEKASPETGRYRQSS